MPLKNIKIFKSNLVYITNGIITILHIPLLLVVYIIKPLIKIRFGYFTTERIGHFALDVGYAIHKKKNKNEINLYYLQGNVSNKQFAIIAKRELNISQYYKYFVYAYILCGLDRNVMLPQRHINGSRDNEGIMYYSKYDILFLDNENKIAESYMKKYGWTKGKKFVCLNVRDSGFFNEKELSRHSYRNSDIDDYEAAANYLLDLGYWVVRTGKKVNKPFKIKHNRMIDYGVDPDRSDLIDIWLCKNCYFFISTGTGIDSVAAIFKSQLLLLNTLPLIVLFSWNNGITVPKRMFWDSGKELSLTEHLNNSYGQSSQYKEKGIKVINLSPSEIKLSVQEMVSVLDGMPLTRQKIKIQKKFWNILEHHELYDNYHGVRNPNSLFGVSFLENNPNFLV